ncbi:GGDEF domain-containing protein [Alkalicoccus chagannorensis]|uniref:GGDEF domain-containing protein n=1 Tax=Alkalicoccus chagannorensis TaxID=427072 RepID=UPI00041C3D70|nr:diguanylate cyclase [Alkalicoccus chagannorensis]
MTIHPYIFYMLLMAMLALLLTIQIFRHSATHARTYLAALLTSGGAFMILTAAELSASSETLMLWLRNLQQLPLFITPVLLFGLAREYAGYGAARTRRWLLFLTAPVLLQFLLILFDQQLGLLRVSTEVVQFGTLSEISVTQTFLGAITIVYPSSVALLAASILFIQLLRSNHSERVMNTLFFIAFILPVAYMLSVPALPWNFPGQIAVGFTVTSGILLVLYYKYDLLAVWPVAGERIFETMTEGILIISSGGRIKEWNSAAEQMLMQLTPGLPAQWRGLPCTDILPEVSNFDKHTVQDMQEESWTDENLPLRVRARLYPMKSLRSGEEASLLMLTNVTKDYLYQEALYRRATIDYLTGTANRSYFIEQLEEVISMGRSFTFVLLDLDYFKQFNDRYGHQAGDEVLQFFASLLMSHAEGHGFSGRIGGEEFAAVCWMEEEEAARNVQQLQLQLMNNPLTFDGEPESVQFSAGTAVFDPALGGSFSDLYATADNALYIAKRAGRNQIVTSRGHSVQGREKDRDDSPASSAGRTV